VVTWKAQAFGATRRSRLTVSLYDVASAVWPVAAIGPYRTSARVSFWRRMTNFLPHSSGSESSDPHEIHQGGTHRETQLFVQLGTSTLRLLDLERVRPDFRREMLVHSMRKCSPRDTSVRRQNLSEASSIHNFTLSFHIVSPHESWRVYEVRHPGTPLATASRADDVRVPDYLRGTIQLRFPRSLIRTWRLRDRVADPAIVSPAIRSRGYTSE
jgi:hypothetical protein